MVAGGELKISKKNGGYRLIVNLFKEVRLTNKSYLYGISLSYQYNDRNFTKFYKKVTIIKRWEGIKDEFSSFGNESIREENYVI